MDKLFKNFVSWTDTFFDDTAHKLVKIFRILSKVFVWVSIVCGWIGLLVGIIGAIASKSFGAIFAALLCPVWGYFGAILIAISFALSIMVLNALSDISIIRKSVEIKGGTVVPAKKPVETLKAPVVAAPSAIPEAAESDKKE